ncbi:MAG: hypothetical protein LYZ66_05475 [Nitrososphaerales archaeon]|nr:hypothetical protein [Nitrososphaerales archaeon]
MDSVASPIDLIRSALPKSVEELAAESSKTTRGHGEISPVFTEIVVKYSREAQRNVRLRLEYRETFLDNRALSIRLGGLLATNKTLSKISGQPASTDAIDKKMIEKYVLAAEEDHTKPKERNLTGQA